MGRHKFFLIGVLGVWLFGGLAQSFAEESHEGATRYASLISEPMQNMRYVSGEIAWVDVKLGKLQLNDHGLRGYQAKTEYRVNQRATNVTDPSDKKFLTLDDLRSGQRVTIEFEPANSQGELVAREITIESTPGPAFQEAFGEVEAIDANAGTLVLDERPAIREGGNGNLAYFVFKPRDIVVMQNPSRQPVRLELKPGDPVKVEYVVKDGKRWAQSITLYSALPELSDRTTTITTTTSTTTKQ